MMTEPTERELNAAGNGDMLHWHEYEADQGRGTFPDDCQGGSDPDAPTNVEMHKSCKGLIERLIPGFFEEKTSETD